MEVGGVGAGDIRTFRLPSAGKIYLPAALMPARERQESGIACARSLFLTSSISRSLPSAPGISER